VRRKMATKLSLLLSTILIFGGSSLSPAVATEVTNLNVFASVESGFRFYDNQFGAYMSYQVVKLRNASNTDTIYGCDVRFSLLRADGTTYYSSRSSYTNSIPPNSSRYTTLVNLTNDSNYGERWYSVKIDSISCTKESTLRVDSRPFVMTIGDEVQKNDWIFTSVQVSNPSASIARANSNVIAYSPSGDIVYSTVVNCSDTPYALYEWPPNVTATCKIGRHASVPFSRYEFLWSQYTLPSDLQTKPSALPISPSSSPTVEPGQEPEAKLPAMVLKQKLTSNSIAKQINMKVPAKAKVTLYVAKSSRSVCKVVAGKLVALKKGKCSVSVTVTPAKTKTVKKPKATKKATVVSIS
jgi:hypothetical protein